VESSLSAIGYVIIFYRDRANIFDWTIEWAMVREMIKYAWPLIFSAAFVNIYSRVDQVMIKHFLGNTSVGYYDVAVRMSELWYFFPLIIIGSIFPAVLNALKISPERYGDRLSRLYGLAFYLSLLFVLPMAVLAKFIIKIAYGVSFLQAAPVLSIYVWAGIAVAVSSVLNQALIGEKKTKVSFLINMLGMSLNVLLNILLIPLFGINGAAFATLISYSVIPFSVYIFPSTRHHCNLLIRGIFFK